MRAVDRTLKLFLAAVEAAKLPTVGRQISRSVNQAGHSRYVLLYFKERGPVKVRISDHGIGTGRARAERVSYEVLYIPGGAKPDTWSPWLSRLARAVGAPAGDYGPLFDGEPR